jgi:GH15 family glucan-1,4-alpha-glucosidase
VPAPIRDHALLSDCRTAALVTCGGAVDWWPAPRFDSPSAFSGVLDDDAGHWTLRPAGSFESERRYRPGTLVLETMMRTAGGTLRVCDALAFARVAEALDGEVEVELECVPRLEYGLAVPRVVDDSGGVATLGGPERIFLRGDRALRAERSRAFATFALRAGERAGFTLHRVPGAYAQAPPPLDPHAALSDTTAAWRSWADMHSGYEGVEQDAVRFAAIVIQGLTYQPSGAVVAAPTTSLPEIPGGDANWDYRYGWLRDAAMIARALSASTCSDEAKRYFDWIVRAGVTCGEADRMQIMFGVEGERDLAEHELDHLAGHLDSRPVRVGNDAWRQQQLDVLGAFVLASFWLAECHARAGRAERAHEVFARAAGAANDLGLLAEEVDPATGEPLGNVPQAIAHIGLVNAAQALTEAEAGVAVP